MRCNSCANEEKFITERLIYHWVLVDGDNKVTDFGDVQGDRENPTGCEDVLENAHIECYVCNSTDIQDGDVDDEPEAPPTSPEPEDYVIFDSGPLGSRTSLCQYEGKYLGEFSMQIYAIEAIRTYMDKEKFYPNVWYLSDHGNWTLINLEEEYPT